MKLFTGWVISAGLVLTAAAANAQTLAPYEIGEAPYAVASDIDGPYAEMPPEALAPRYRPILLPPSEIYAIIRDSGFSPLEIPQQRGLVYTIAVIDRGSGDDGRLVVDARSGRIVRFMPAYRMGDNLNEGLRMRYGPVGPLPPVTAVRGPPRPPLSIPRLASRTPYVPMPPRRTGEVPPRRAGEVKPLAAGGAPAQHSAPEQQSAPAQQSAAVQAKPAETTPQPAAPAVEAKPATPEIRPTQEMPKVQDLE